MKAQEVTLYSGGARGTEAAFGEAAAAFEVAEVNFTFVGHHINRSVHMQTLSPEELTKSDVSLAEVSKRLGRDYSTRPWIRQILQSIWHQVNNGYQVFVVGEILWDGTVKGGTGWAAELAKLYNRPLHVFDQVKETWFTWKTNTWVAETPVIEHHAICGTGTRHITDAAIRAINELFERSIDD